MGEWHHGGRRVKGGVKDRKSPSTAEERKKRVKIHRDRICSNLHKEGGDGERFREGEQMKGISKRGSNQGAAGRVSR